MKKKVQLYTTKDITQQNSNHRFSMFWIDTTRTQVHIIDA